MPEDFYKHVKQLKIHSYIQLLTIVFAIIACGLALGMLSDNKTTSACLAVISVSLFIVFFSFDRIKNRSFPDFYTALISTDDIENTLLKHGADKIADDAYVWFCSISGFQICTLVLRADEFERDTISNKKRRINRIINQKYNISQEISISDSYAKLRINLLIVNCDSIDIHNWISKNAAIFLGRAEPIINAAIVLDKKELFFPALQENVQLNELNKYLAAAEMLTRIFCS